MRGVCLSSRTFPSNKRLLLPVTSAQSICSLFTPPTQSDFVYYDGAPKTSLSREERTEARRNRTPARPPPPPNARSPLVRRKLVGAAKRNMERKMAAAAAAAATAKAETGAAVGGNGDGGDTPGGLEGAEAAAGDSGRGDNFEAASNEFESAASAAADRAVHNKAAEHFRSWTSNGDSEGAVAAATAAAAAAAALLKRGETPFKQDEADHAKSLLSGLATAFHSSPTRVPEESWKRSPGGFGDSPAEQDNGGGRNGVEAGGRSTLTISARDRDLAHSPSSSLSSSPVRGKRVSPMSSPLSSRMMTPHLSMDYHRSESPGIEDCAGGTENGGDPAHMENGDSQAAVGQHSGGSNCDRSHDGGSSLADECSNSGRLEGEDGDAPKTQPPCSASPLLRSTINENSSGDSCAASAPSSTTAEVIGTRQDVEDRANGGDKATDGTAYPNAEETTTSINTSRTSSSGSTGSSHNSPTASNSADKPSSPVCPRRMAQAGVVDGDAWACNGRRDTRVPVRLTPTLAWNPPPPDLASGGLQRSCKRRKMLSDGAPSPSSSSLTPGLMEVEGRAATANRRPSSAP